MKFKFSVVTDTIRRLGYDILETPREILEVVKAAGYDAVDIPGGQPERVEAPVFRELVKSLALEISEVSGAWAYFHAGEKRDLAGSDEIARERGVAYAKQAIDLAVELDAKFFNICAAQPPVPQVPFPKLPLSGLRQNFLSAARDICEYAAERGIVVLFEPLNRYEAYPGVLTTVYDAIGLVDALELSNLGIQPDVYHMNIAEASITEALRAGGRRIRVVHSNETNHYYLGEGHADYKAIIRTLKEINFNGYISVYMPLISQEISYAATDRVTGGRPDLKIVLERQLRFLREIELAVDGQRTLYRTDVPYIADRLPTTASTIRETDNS